MDDWLGAHVEGLAPPYEISLIVAGGSNLTYRAVDTRGRAVVVGRPPEGRTLAGAHDIDREWRIMSALDRAGALPVPHCLARCDDPAVTGAPFYVMDFVDGRILRDRADAEQLDHAAGSAATDALVGGQVVLHTLDLDRVGLAELGRHDGYVARQLRRWRTQVERGGVRDLPIVGELHDALAARLPPERARPALAHGDYRFDNVVLAADLSLAAVLDWELCTTGDPIADFAWSMGYWADPGDDLTWLPDPPTIAASMPRRDEVIARYRAATGFDLDDWPFYEAFSWWKHGCVVEGAHARRLAGSRGGMDTAGSARAIAERADALLDRAHELVTALG